VGELLHMPACCEGTIICGVDAEIEIIECSDHTSNGREGRHGSLSLFDTIYCIAVFTVSRASHNRLPVALPLVMYLISSSPAFQPLIVYDPLL
jgi:hypothetical protein